jgi:hypothetical protein
VTGRADRGDRLGGKPRAGGDVKDAHTPCNTGRAQNEGMKYLVTCAKGRSYSAPASKTRLSVLYPVVPLRMEDLPTQLMIARA